MEREKGLLHGEREGNSQKKLTAWSCPGREWELLWVTGRQFPAPPPLCGHRGVRHPLSPQQQPSIGRHAARDQQGARSPASSLPSGTDSREEWVQFCAWKCQGLDRAPCWVSARPLVPSLPWGCSPTFSSACTASGQMFQAFRQMATWPSTRAFRLIGPVWTYSV